jgi:hypothetical protein
MHVSKYSIIDCMSTNNDNVFNNSLFELFYENFHIESVPILNAGLMYNHSHKTKMYFLLKYGLSWSDSKMRSDYWYKKMKLYAPV